VISTTSAHGADPRAKKPDITILREIILEKSGPAGDPLWERSSRISPSGVMRINTVVKEIRA
jgi:hypothetical protein